MKYCPNCKALLTTLVLADQGDAEERCAACGFRLQAAELLLREPPNHVSLFAAGEGS